MDIQLTPYADVNDFVKQFTELVVRELQGNLVGVYITGSLSYQAFIYDSSDIDFTVLVQRPVFCTELHSLRRLHQEIEGQFEKWARRLECSYTPVEMLPNLLPPRNPRPWYWGGTGTLYEEAPYGNEWIINRYFLYRSGIAFYGIVVHKKLERATC
ncbi:MAG: hypothetical protein O2954_03475 [bacterium]|nr:hypothetical protein [bacterium]